MHICSYGFQERLTTPGRAIRRLSVWIRTDFGLDAFGRIQAATRNNLDGSSDSIPGRHNLSIWSGILGIASTCVFS